MEIQRKKFIWMHCWDLNRSLTQTSKVCKLKKSLFRLKQSPRAWFEKFTQFIKNQGYTGTVESYNV